jgi:hypothetical protein
MTIPTTQNTATIPAHRVRSSARVKRTFREFSIGYTEGAKTTGRRATFEACSENCVVQIQSDLSIRLSFSTYEWRNSWAELTSKEYEFGQLILWRVSSSGIWRRVVRWVALDVSWLTRWFAELSSTLKMEAIRSSETSGATQRTTGRHNPEDDTLHNHRCENLKSYY